MARIRVKHHPNTVKKALLEWRDRMGISMDVFYSKGIEIALYSKEYSEELERFLSILLRDGYILEWYRLHRYNDDECAYITFKAFITSKL